MALRSRFLKSTAPAGGVLGKHLLSLLFLFLILSVSLFSGVSLVYLLGGIDWNTIFTLSGLLVITAMARESGVLDSLAEHIVGNIGTERALALILSFFTAFLSMLLTNDVALFIVIPLTLTLRRFMDGEYCARLVVFEAIASNVGSSLSPIGNPQNIFLWHRWNISFFAFAGHMAPPFLLMSFVLSLMIFLVFRGRKINITRTGGPVENRKLFVVSLVLLVLFCVSSEIGLEMYAFPAVVLFALALCGKAFRESDWGLIVIFISLFLVLRLLEFLGNSWLVSLGAKMEERNLLFFYAVFLSQAVNNVSAAVLLSAHSSDFKTIAYGVNIGGNGIFTASFANLIALRFLGKGRKMLFHRYSMIFLALTLVISVFVLL